MLIAADREDARRQRIALGAHYGWRAIQGIGLGHAPGVEHAEVVESGCFGFQINRLRHVQADDTLVAADAQGQCVGVEGRGVRLWRRGRWRRRGMNTDRQ